MMAGVAVRRHRNAARVLCDWGLMGFWGFMKVRRKATSVAF
jgi:hypothetical protein